MTIATKNGVPIVKDGVIASNCGCCEDELNVCGQECPGALEQIASEIQFIASDFQFQSFGAALGVLTLFQPGDVIPCFFTRTQESFTVFSSDPDLSDSVQASAASSAARFSDPAIQAIFANMQSPQRLIELFVPCNPSTQFVNGVFVIAKFFEKYPFLSFTTTVLNTNLEIGMQLVRPGINCNLDLSPAQNAQSSYAANLENISTFPSLFKLRTEAVPLP